MLNIKNNITITICSCYFYRAQATVEGVYEEYNKRSAYIAYLVKSQQKFQDAKLQVAAIQTAVDR